ncbi:MAG: Rrf2 family transcriptional regulator [Pyrinomonas methylaliphatogenes]|nr:Rrf2 family transcriptional regulator [Pyrinomonas methylaliphatogenes]
MMASSRFAVAVHVLALLARAGDVPVKSGEIARSVNTNPVVIRRILCALSRARLVVARRGASGGAQLARTPARIKLSEVYRAVECGSPFSLHPAPLRRCAVGRNICAVLERVQGEVEGAIERALAKISLQDVLDELQACGAQGAKRDR